MAKKIFVGTPAYDGKVHVQYAMSLLDTEKMLNSMGYEVTIRLPVGGSLLVANRNRLLQMFWESGAEYMLAVDSDLGWDPRVVPRLIGMGKEFSAGVYPSRDNLGFTFRPSLEPDQRIAMCPETKLLKMEYIPAGFMLIKRSVVEKLHKKFPELKYQSRDPKEPSDHGFCIFDTEVRDEQFWGEDYVFCRRVREAGVDIWVDPTIEFDHAGIRGALLQVLTTDPKEAGLDQQP